MFHFPDTFQSCSNHVQSDLDILSDTFQTLSRHLGTWSNGTLLDQGWTGWPAQSKVTPSLGDPMEGVMDGRRVGTCFFNLDVHSKSAILILGSMLEGKVLKGFHYVAILWDDHKYIRREYALLAREFPTRYIPCVDRGIEIHKCFLYCSDENRPSHSGYETVDC